jgi:23S rRNA (guanosine2251-2'-O)-methyltransferase
MPIVCGIHPVLEALSAGSRTIERVIVTKGVRNKRILEVIRKASERGIPLRFEPRDALDRAADGERHQGVLALVSEKALLSLDELQASARTPALFVLLDGVEDPRNLGAVVRSAEAAGADGLLLPDRHTASLSDSAARTAAGALDHLKIARIGNVVQALEQLKQKGHWIVGFDGAGKERWDQVDYKRPVVMVLGGEGRGIRRLVREHCDHLVSLPMFGHVGSLNVSVAAGIALFEAVRQRGSVPTMARPIPTRALMAKKPVVIGPAPEDREEDPGARRRAALIALETMSARAVDARPVPAAPGEPVLPSPRAGDADNEADVREAALEPLTSPGTDPDEAEGSNGPRDRGRETGSDEEGDDAEKDDADADAHADDADAEDDEDDEDEDEDEEREGAETGDGDSHGEADEDGDEEDDGDNGDGEHVGSFMPQDEAGEGEVTWGSERRLHSHRPRRDGDRRFGRFGSASGRGDRKNRAKKPSSSGGSSPPPASNKRSPDSRPNDRPASPRNPVASVAGTPENANSVPRDKGQGAERPERNAGKAERPDRGARRRRRGRNRNRRRELQAGAPPGVQGPPAAESVDPAEPSLPKPESSHSLEGEASRQEAGGPHRRFRRRRRRGSRGPGGNSNGNGHGGSNDRGGGSSGTGGGIPPHGA